MSDPMNNAEIEDVLSSIRRLVAGDGRARRATATPETPASQKAESSAPQALVLSPEDRVSAPKGGNAGPVAKVSDAGAEAQNTVSVARSDPEQADKAAAETDGGTDVVGQSATVEASDGASTDSVSEPPKAGVEPAAPMPEARPAVPNPPAEASPPRTGPQRAATDGPPPRRSGFAFGVRLAGHQTARKAPGGANGSPASESGPAGGSGAVGQPRQDVEQRRSVAPVTMVTDENAGSTIPSALQGRSKPPWAVPRDPETDTDTAQQVRAAENFAQDISTPRSETENEIAPQRPETQAASNADPQDVPEAQMAVDVPPAPLEANEAAERATRRSVSPLTPAVDAPGPQAEPDGASPGAAPGVVSDVAAQQNSLRLADETSGQSEGGDVGQQVPTHGTAKALVEPVRDGALRRSDDESSGESLNLFGPADAAADAHLRVLVQRVLQEELEGAFGDRLSQRLRALVRHEVQKALAELLSGDPERPAQPKGK